MRVVLTQRIPASPEVVWEWITEPKRVNRWSIAKINMVSADEGKTSASVGAKLDITVRGLFRKISFQEVIEEAEPGRRLVYRVLEGPHRRHRGEFHLRPVGDQTDLRWEWEYKSAVPGLARVLSWMVKPQLRRCLTHLAGIVQHAQPTPTP